MSSQPVCGCGCGCATPTLKAREDGADLKPLNAAQGALLAQTAQYVSDMIVKGLEHQKMLNAEHRSEFNPYLLYEGCVTYSERCDAAGHPDPQGGFCRGARGIIESSVAPNFDYFTIDYVGDSDKLIAHLGSRAGAEQSGILVDTRYPLNLMRLTKQMRGAYRKAKYEHEIIENTTPTDSTLKVWKECASVAEALDAIEKIVTIYLERVSLEGKFFNLFRIRPNMIEIHDDNLQDFIRIPGEEKPSYPERVLLITSTRVCRRCRAEFQEVFTDYTAAHPEIQFGVVFTDKPKMKFIPVVFEGHCGGVRNSGFVTPFIIPYRKGEYCGRYLATGKHDEPPSVADIQKMVEEYFA